MKIAIIGKGNVGSALEAGLTRSGHEVRTTGADAQEVRAAAAPADIIILAIPAQAREDAIRNLGDIAGKILVDPTNLLNPDWSYSGDLQKSGAEQVQEWAPGARVVKAFNTVFAQNMATGKVQGESLSLLAAGDDAEAKKQVLELGQAIGFEPSTRVRYRMRAIWKRSASSTSSWDTALPFTARTSASRSSAGPGSRCAMATTINASVNRQVKAPHPMLANAPHRIGKVALTVRDLDRVSGFYQAALGLEPIERDGDVTRLGSGSSVLIELRHDPDARPRTRREAGLFHTAFLLPDRAELGAWLAFAAQQQLPLLGASDHLVSEAVYLTDPEGNGIEIYADRPSEEWPRANGMIEMPSQPLDLRDLAGAAAGRIWSGFPAGGVIGHVHLQVGDIAAAEAFYGNLGFDITCRYPGGSFYGSGGYHHQLATNVWNSQGAPVRPERTTGVAEVEILADASVLEGVRPEGTAARTSVSLRDPWGTSISLRAR